ncbi:FbpB family small basic protein [Virgibacillus sp. 179-BFC.A HS]|uniref:FbpB family small basic protein n=1 Tax=Tigheibacillus jepli TaxID=3035914 RepID=A0ABU5CHI7_9BACI|nr:FbpB family small basic protein [Virgibacillus sp. 179-BFC.A HS]MDY0405783.1 FbpB family small basic protein [Virgibacillus sp. 179-BFC.A HS]
MQRGDVAIALKRNISFEELVRANREQILRDRKLLDEIEETIDRRMYQSVKSKKKA